MRRLVAALALCAAGVLASAPAWATDCPRPALGSEVLPPPDLYGSNGILNVDLPNNPVVRLRN